MTWLKDGEFFWFQLMSCQVPSGASGRLRQRQRKQERRTMVQFALGADRSTVGQHDVFGDGQPQAGAAGFARAGFIYAIKAFEKPGQVFRWNAGAEIAYVEFG